jgi:hypothetical protein
VTAGAAASDAISGWDSAPRVVATVLLWLAWGAGAVAVLAPRPVGLTALRTIAPAFVILAFVASITADVSALAGWGGLAATFASAVLTADSEIALAAANGAAYGDEERFPLRTPPALFLGLLPLTRALVVVSVAGGPLLLAGGEVLWGSLALVAGVAVTVVGARALHALSRRWVVLVPAGVVIADPMTLADPTLFIRRHVRALRAADPATPGTEDRLDLRLGATLGTVEVVLDEETDLMRSARGRRGGTLVHVSALLVAVVRAPQMLETAARRRVRVELRGGDQRTAT